MAWTYGALVIFKDPDFGSIVELIKKEFPEEFSLDKETEFPSGKILEYSRSSGNPDKITVEVGSLLGASYANMSYTASDNADNSVLKRVFKTLCRERNALLGTIGLQEGWPPIKEIIKQAKHSKLPSINGNPKVPFHGPVLFLSNTYVKKYDIDFEKVSGLNPERINKGIYLDWMNSGSNTDVKAVLYLRNLLME